MKQQQLIIYFDGACHLCSREMGHYFQKDVKGVLLPRDIKDPAFDAAKEGLDPRRVNQYMHVRTSDGKVFTGVEAFIEIWKVVPGYERMARIASIPWVKAFLKPFYFIFARGIRPLLPKRKGVCELKKI